MSEKGYTQLWSCQAEVEVWALHAVSGDTPWWEGPSLPLVGVGVPAPHGEGADTIPSPWYPKVSDPSQSAFSPPARVLSCWFYR